MTAANKKIIDFYLQMLAHLDNEAKMFLIDALKDSLKKKPKKKDEDDSWENLYGAWKGEETAEEFVEFLRNSRTFTRKDIQL